MGAEKPDQIADHTAGRTVAHRSRFEHLEVPNRPEHPTHLVDRWILPFYMTAPQDPTFGERYRALRAEATPALAGELLSYINWRPKAVGAYVVGIERHESQRELVGRLDREAAHTGLVHLHLEHAAGIDPSHDVS